MAMADLLIAFERETDEAVREFLALARADAERIEAEATRTRTDQIARAGAAAATEHRAALDRALAERARVVRGEVLVARAAMLDRVRAAVAAELPALLAADPRLGDALLAAAIACAGTDAGALHCAPALADRARAAAPPALQVVADSQVATGAVIELVTGTRIDATLAHLLDRAWPELACEAVERLAQERAPARGDA